MYSFKQNIKYMIIFIVLAILTVWGIFSFNKECSITDLLGYMKNSHPIWIILAFCFMVGFIVFEGFAISCLINGLGGGRSYLKGPLYSAADIYFSAITPSASGGQPASAYFMIKNGVNPALTTVVLLVNLILYSMSLLLFGFAALMRQLPLFISLGVLSKVLILFGTIIMFVLCICFILLLTKKQIVYNIVLFLIQIGIRIKVIKRPGKYLARLDRMMEQYEESSKAVVGKGSMLLKAFCFNLLQRLSHTLVSVCCYMAMGGTKDLALKVGEVQMFCSLGANSIPIPGGMGVTDFLLMKCFGEFLSENIAGNLALLCRGVAFYGSIAVSVLIILIGVLVSWTKRKC